MSAGDFFEDYVTDLAGGGDFIPDIAGLTETGAVEIHNIIHGNGCDVFIEYDPLGDDSYSFSVKIDELTNEGISQINKLEINSNSDDMRLRIHNTTVNNNDYSVSGIEVIN